MTCPPCAPGVPASAPSDRQGPRPCRGRAWIGPASRGPLGESESARDWYIRADARAKLRSKPSVACSAQCGASPGWRQGRRGGGGTQHRFAHPGLLLSTWLQQLGAKGGTLRVEPMMKARVEMDGHSNTRGALSALVRAKLLGQGAAASWPHNGRSDQA